MKIVVAFEKKLSDNKATRIKQSLIKKWTKSEYFHVEIIIDGYWYSADTKRGLIKRKLKPLKDSYDYLTVFPSTCQENKRLAAEFIDSQVGKKYDWAAIYLTQLLKIGIENKDRWFCSEIVAKVLQILQIREFVNTKPSLMSPQDVFYSLSKSGFSAEGKDMASNVLFV
jgi:ribosomal protein S17E